LDKELHVFAILKSFFQASKKYFAACGGKILF